MGEFFYKEKKKTRGIMKSKGVNIFMGEIIAFLYKWEIFRKDDKFICVREELLQKFP